MNDKKIKVAMVTNHIGITGIGTVMMNYCMALDKKKYDLTILAGQPISEKYEKECLENGIHLVALPSRHGNPKSHYIALWKALRAGHYDIAHDHGSSSMMAIELTIAKLAGVKNRIAHSHNSTCPNMKVHKLLNRYFRTVYTKALACGKLAGNWLFGENNFEEVDDSFSYTRSELYLSKEDARKVLERRYLIKAIEKSLHNMRFSTFDGISDQTLQNLHNALIAVEKEQTVLKR